LNTKDGGFPDVDKGGAITQDIFDAFHTELYPGVTAFREEYVRPTAQEQDYVHLNWGLRLYSDNIEGDMRTLFNANFQSYSVLTQIAAVEFDKVIEEQGMREKVDLINIIHDCLYYEIDDDIATIKWVNDNLPKVMAKQFIHGQAIELRAENDVGYNLYDVVTLPNNIDEAKIKELLDGVSRI